MPSSHEPMVPGRSAQWTAESPPKALLTVDGWQRSIPISSHLKNSNHFILSLSFIARWPGKGSAGWFISSTLYLWRSFNGISWQMVWFGESKRALLTFLVPSWLGGGTQQGPLIWVASPACHPRSCWTFYMVAQRGCFKRPGEKLQLKIPDIDFHCMLLAKQVTKANPDSMEGG